MTSVSAHTTDGKDSVTSDEATVGGGMQARRWNPHEDRRARMTAFHAGELGNHQLTDRPAVRAWTFQRVTAKGRQWCPYGFKLVWTQGMFALTGDLGELQVVHYNALYDLEASLQWLANGEFDYIMSKTPEKKVFDVDLTLDFIWSSLMGESVEAARAYAQELRRYRELVKEAENDPTVDRFFCPQPKRPDEIDGPFNKFAGDSYWSFQIAAGETPPARRSWRAGLKRELRERLNEEGSQAAYDITCALFGDHYVGESYTVHHEMQVAAMQFASRHILDHEFSKEASA